MNQLPPTKVVAEIGRISFTGDIIPSSWYHHIKRPNGRPCLEAVVILAEIIYWYRPREERDEVTGQVKAITRKFRRDKLQRTYQQLADKFGFSKEVAKDACHILAKMGLITIEFRTLHFDGLTLANVTFIEPVPSKIKEISFPVELGGKKTDKVEGPDLGGGDSDPQGRATEGETNTETSQETSSKTSEEVLTGLKEEAVKTSKEDQEKIINEIYEAYPKHVGKPKAKEAISKVLKKGNITAQVLLERTKLYARVRGTDEPNYIPHPTTWFNQYRFNDDPKTWEYHPRNGNGHSPRREVTEAEHKLGFFANTSVDPNREGK